MTTDRIDLIDKNNAWGLLFRLIKHVANARCANADKHLDKIRSRNREERHFSFAGNRFSKQGFTRTGLSHHEDAARYTSAQLLKATGVTQKLNKLLYVFLGFIDACNVGKRCRNLVLTQQLCLALTKAHWATTTTAATLHLTHEEHENRQNKQNREARNQ